VYSGIEAIEAEDQHAAAAGGRGTNVIGSRLFKNLVAVRKMGGGGQRDCAAGRLRGGAQSCGRVPAKHGARRKKDIPPFYEKRFAVKAR